MGELDEVADALERITRDPMADAVRGTARITSASERAPRGRYQECAVDLVVEGLGLEPRTIRTVVVTSKRYWPQVGTVLPARVSRTDPDAVEIDWDALAG